MRLSPTLMWCAYIWGSRCRGRTLYVSLMRGPSFNRDDDAFDCSDCPPGEDKLACRSDSVRADRALSRRWGGGHEAFGYRGNQGPYQRHLFPSSDSDGGHGVLLPARAAARWSVSL